MRVLQPVSTSTPCPHCKGSGKCLCKNVCEKKRAETQALLDEHEVDIRLAPPKCTVCFGRGKVQEWELVLDAPRSEAKVRRPGERRTRAAEPPKNKGKAVFRIKDPVPGRSEHEKWEERKRQQRGGA